MGRVFGDGSTDYEQYTHSLELFKLMKDSTEWANEDECLFQTTHMSMELWLAVVIQHIDQTVEWINEDKPLKAAGMLNRASDIVDLLNSSLRFLEDMTPWNYHAIRVGLKKGSGQQSPTFDYLLTAGAPILEAYNKLLERSGVNVDEIQQSPDKHNDLYQLTAALLTYDENFMRWRYAHFQLVKRIIGDRVMSLKGVPASALRDGTEKAQFPDLWESINRTTRAFNEQHGAPGDSGYIVSEDN